MVTCRLYGARRRAFSVFGVAFALALAMVGRSHAERPIAPDNLVLQSVCKPTFTVNGVRQPSGTGFLVETVHGRRRTYLFTAQHLFSYPPSEIASHVTQAECKPPLSDHSFLTGPAVPIAGAHPMGALEGLKDVAVFPVIGHSPGLPLAETDVEPGDMVWLLANVRSGRETTSLLHRARVERTHGYLAYRFDDQSSNPDQTSGGAVINAAGEVVGLNVGYGRTKGGELIGVADRLSTLQSVVAGLPRE